MTTGKALLGVLAGIAAGTFIGMLLAKSKDDKLKKVILRESEDLVDAIDDKIDQKFAALLKAISLKMKKADAQTTDVNSPEV